MGTGRVDGRYVRWYQSKGSGSLVCQWWSVGGVGGVDAWVSEEPRDFDRRRHPLNACFFLLDVAVVPVGDAPVVVRHGAMVAWPGLACARAVGLCDACMYVCVSERLVTS